MLAYCGAGDELVHGGESFPTESHVNHKLCFFFSFVDFMCVLSACVSVYNVRV